MLTSSVSPKTTNRACNVPILIVSNHSIVIFTVFFSRFTLLVYLKVYKWAVSGIGGKRDDGKCVFVATGVRVPVGESVIFNFLFDKFQM